MLSDRPRGGAWYALALLFLVYLLNFLDRQLLTVLAPAIKADLGLSDAQLGLLYGTAFAFFYALLGLPIARLADGWNRVWTVVLGLALWSLMTAGSGLAAGFVGLAVARMGVGVGEASAAPAGYSLLQDLFPPRRRATAIALYSSGIFLGAGLAGIVAAPILGWWHGLEAQGAAPLARSGWQMVFLFAGVPGLALAVLLAASLREPARPRPATPPFVQLRADLATLAPPFSLLRLANTGERRWNAAVLVICLLLIAPATYLTDAMLAPARRMPFAHLGPIGVTTNLVQWTAIALGLYAAASWFQRVAAEDKAAVRLLFGAPAARLTIAGVAVQNIVNYAFAGFSFLYGTRHAGLVAGDAAVFGVLVAIGGFAGTSGGGLLADALARRWAWGRLAVAIGCALASLVAFAAQLSATGRTGYLAAFVVAQAVSTLWFGPVTATVQGLVVPRLRGLAAAVQLLAVSLVGLGIGPYAVGLVSDGWSLGAGLALTLPLLPVSAWLYWRAARHLAADEALVATRAAPSVALEPLP